MSMHHTTPRHILLNVFITLTVWVATSSSFAAGDPTKASAPALYSITPAELSHEISLSIDRVPEFKFLQQEAAKMGIKAYLFGGTASSFAHYVRWDMLRKKGDTRLLEDRFDYDTVDIFRNNQDLDIVVDGSPEQAKQLEQILASRYPIKQENKSAWEVRPLRESMGLKSAILGDVDFMNQHTDSNSTGVIDISKNAKDVMKDVRDWNNPNSQFEKDVVAGKIHFYYSPNHESTKMALSGNNPAIVSVVRLLVKALQFDLEIAPEDLPNIKKITDEFRASSIQGDYLKGRFNNTSNKLVANSIDVERTMDILDYLQIRQQLITVAGSSTPLGILLNKEALPSKPLGTSGRTAQDMGLSDVVHSTRNIEAYYSIIRSPTGQPNVFSSRENAPGEKAIYGKGFYVAEGTTPLHGEELSIHFKLDPRAVEGVDFKYVPSERFLVIMNKNALHLTAQSRLGIKDMLALVMPKSGMGSPTRDKMWRKIVGRMGNLTDTEYVDLHNGILEGLNTFQHATAHELLRICVRNPRCTNEKLETLFNEREEQASKTLKARETVENYSGQKINPEITDAFFYALKKQFAIPDLAKNFAAYIGTGNPETQMELLNKLTQEYPHFVRWVVINMPFDGQEHLLPFLLKELDVNSLARFAKANPKLQLKIAEGIKNSNTQIEFIRNLGLGPEFAPIVASLAKNATADQYRFVADYANLQPGKVQLEIATALVDAKNYQANFSLGLLTKKDRPELLPLVKKLIATGQLSQSGMFSFILDYAQGNRSSAPEIYQALLDVKSESAEVFAERLNLPKQSDLQGKSCTKVFGS
jgi:hypothetical protein